MTTKIVIVDYGMGNLLDYAEDKPPPRRPDDAIARLVAGDRSAAVIA